MEGESYHALTAESMDWALAVQLIKGAYGLQAHSLPGCP